MYSHRSQTSTHRKRIKKTLPIARHLPNSTKLLPPQMALSRNNPSNHNRESIEKPAASTISSRRASQKPTSILPIKIQIRIGGFRHGELSVMVPAPTFKQRGSESVNNRRCNSPAYFTSFPIHPWSTQCTRQWTEPQFNCRALFTQCVTSGHRTGNFYTQLRGEIFVGRRDARSPTPPWAHRGENVLTRRNCLAIRDETRLGQIGLHPSHTLFDRRKPDSSLQTQNLREFYVRTPTNPPLPRHRRRKRSPALTHRPQYTQSLQLLCRPRYTQPGPAYESPMLFIVYI